MNFKPINISPVQTKILGRILSTSYNMILATASKRLSYLSSVGYHEFNVIFQAGTNM